MAPKEQKFKLGENAVADVLGQSEPASAPAPLSSDYAGPKSYELTEKHYRDGVTYEPGAKVTVINEKPGRSWKPIPFAAEIEVITRKAPPPDAAPKSTLPELGLNAPPTRASDRAI